MAIETLTPAYVVHTGDFADYACLDCARQFADQRGLKWHGADDFTEEDPATDDGVCVVYSWEGAECDYPVSCTCGQYLDNVRLTSDGVAYMLERAEDFPAWLLEAHGVSELSVAEAHLERARYIASNLEQKFLEAQRLWQEAERDSSEAFQRVADLKQDN